MRERAMALAVFLLLMLPPANGLPGYGEALGQEGEASLAPTGQPRWSFTGPVAEGGSWQMTVTASQRAFEPGDGLTVAIDFTINSLGLAYNIDRVSGVYTLVTGLRTFDADGKMIGGSHAMASTVLTGLGMPIEGETQGLPTDRFGGPFHHPIDSLKVTSPADLVVDADAGTIRGTVVHGILLDPQVPAGWYMLRVDLGLQIVEGDVVTLWGVDPTLASTTEDNMTYAIAGPISIGTRSQPQMIWTLFSSSLSGMNIALEDRGWVAASRGLGYSTSAILPMTDSHGGQIRYLLEPDFPLVWNPFMRGVGPSLDLDYRSGWMEVRIQNPDGTVVDLGGAQFNGRRGIGATTLQDRFAYSFSSYGRHRIELTGWIRSNSPASGEIKDSSNQVYVGGGVYEVDIARPLEIETNTLPGTPLKKDGIYDPGFQVYPPMPASVEITWQLDARSRGQATSESFTATANRWGYYSPPILSGRDRFARATRVQFAEPGEYRVSYRATYREEDGTLWMGEKVVNGIVLPSDTVALASRPPASGSFSITSDARYMPVPADTGDTVIVPVPTSEGLPTVYTFPVGFFLGDATQGSSASGFRSDDTALRQVESGAAGIFATPRLASATGLFPHYYPADIDRKAYLVTCAARVDGYSLTRVCEGSPAAHLPYPTYPWFPGELSADAAGDIFHFWSSMVYRDIAANSARYGYYSAGAVISDEVAVPRIHQEGTALTSDGWGAHNLFLHNPAVRPGSIVSEGAPFTSAAYFLPLPPQSTVEFIVTSPQGTSRTVTVNADSSGYACGMRDRFELDQQGVWRVQSRLTQGSETGGILGVREGEPWDFYVIDPGNRTPIKFHTPFFTPLDPEQNLVVLTGDLTDGGIASGTIYITATFNGAVVEQTTRDIGESAFVYSVDLGQVSNSYRNFDPFDSRDRLVITFLAVGLTSSGDRRLAARMVCIQDGVLYPGEKDYTPIDPRSRQGLMEELAESAQSEAREIRGRVPAGTG